MIGAPTAHRDVHVRECKCVQHLRTCLPLRAQWHSTPLQYASKQGHAGAVTLLLEYGAAINRTNAVSVDSWLSQIEVQKGMELSLCHVTHLLTGPMG